MWYKSNTTHENVLLYMKISNFRIGYLYSYLLCARSNNSLMLAVRLESVINPNYRLHWMDNTDALYRKSQVSSFLSTVAQATGYSLSVLWHQRTPNSSTSWLGKSQDWRSTHWNKFCPSLLRHDIQTNRQLHSSSQHLRPSLWTVAQYRCNIKPSRDLFT